MRRGRRFAREAPTEQQAQHQQEDREEPRGAYPLVDIPAHLDQVLIETLTLLVLRSTSRIGDRSRVRRTAEPLDGIDRYPVYGELVIFA